MLIFNKQIFLRAWLKQDQFQDLSHVRGKGGGNICANPLPPPPSCSAKEVHDLQQNTGIESISSFFLYVCLDINLRGPLSILIL